MATPYDRITMESIMQMLPQIQKRKRRVGQLRGIGEEFGRYEESRRGADEMLPTQRGGLYETVAQYRPQGALGSFLGAAGRTGFGSAGDVKESELDTLRQQQSIGALQQIGEIRNRLPGEEAPEGELPETTLRGYLGMIGGPDISKTLTDAARVQSKFEGENGNIWMLMSDGSTKDTGIRFNTVVESVQDTDPTSPTYGKRIMLPKRTSGYQQASATGSPPTTPPVPPLPPKPTMTVEGLSPEQNVAVSDLLKGVPPEMQDQLSAVIAHYAGQGKMTPAQAAGEPDVAPEGVGTPPATFPGAADIIAQSPAPVQPPVQRPMVGPIDTGFKTLTPAQEAGEKVRQEALAASEMSGITAATAAREAGAKEAATGDVQFQQAAIAELPKMEIALNQIRRHIPELIQHPALDGIVGNQVWGRLGNVPLNRIIEDMGLAGTPEADVIARLEQLKGEVFLPAFQYIKGGGQVTNLEGDKAQAAMGRMNRAQSTDDFVAAMKDFYDAYEDAYTKRQEVAMGRYKLSEFQPGGSKYTPPAYTPPAGYSVEP